ncbi:TlyA family RNA methyltransferase [Brasilonema bromeliae]|uniref:TlyA family rRNA (Cytidine-2'-O)-methyltransferase n=1 Tax=Brasilonema bromeliae SPC951 TaxID=385972 RepID=A0ABX1P2J9_9CYAN|nr:TlyA family RNA methyltransferase [Brasilonema bromeliae]NMG18564.1 TlyA family rRNA (cytidine-2'-O)-methyltransferase [Brasilonema bromeliae SPC951]
MVKKRLDTLLVELNLSSSRALAQRFIQAGEVTVDGQIIDKPGTEVDIAAQIQIKERSRFVSRGGEKLAKAIDVFAIPVEGRICLDGGISTGGFTDCLLQAGAKLVYGVDVGYGQVDWRLRNDSRVVLKERTNLRYLTPDELYGVPTLSPPSKGGEYADLAVVDVSFISLTKILPALWQLLQPPREAVLLVKPQFEVGKSRVGKKGVVRDSKDQAEAIFQVLQAAGELGWKYKGLTWSPVTGPAGNIEYLLWLGMESETPPPDIETVHQITILAASELR